MGKIDFLRGFSEGIMMCLCHPHCETICVRLFDFSLFICSVATFKVSPVSRNKRMYMYMWQSKNQLEHPYH
jgi:hypothetical protein